MKNSATVRILLAVSLSLGSLVGGCRSIERATERISNRTQSTVDRVTGRISRTERKVFDSLPGGH